MHLKNDHKKRKAEEIIKHYKCPICSNIQYNYAIDLSYHLKAYHKSYQCYYCDFAGAHLVVLNHVNKMHLDIRNFKCDICQNRFASNAEVKAHKKIHFSKLSDEFYRKINDFWYP